MKPINDKHRAAIFELLIGRPGVTDKNANPAAKFTEWLCREGSNQIPISGFVTSLSRLGNPLDTAQFTEALFLSWPEKSLEVFDNAVLAVKPLPESCRRDYLLGFILGAMEVLDSLSQVDKYGVIDVELPKAFACVVMELWKLPLTAEFDSGISGRMRNAITVFINRVNCWDFFRELGVRQALEDKPCSPAAETLIKEILCKVVHANGVGYMVDIFASGKCVINNRRPDVKA